MLLLTLLLRKKRNSMEYKLTEKQLNEILQYLLTRPAGEVWGILTMIDTLTKEQNPPPSED
jgi:hypothetical protein